MKWLAIFVISSFFASASFAKPGKNRFKKLCSFLDWSDATETRNRAKDQAKKNKNKRRQAMQEQAQLKEVQSEISDILKNSNRQAELLVSTLGFERVAAIGSKGIATVAFGQKGETPSRKTTDKLKEVINKLLDEGYTIKFDADAPSAEIITKLAGARAFGISGNANYGKSKMGDSPIFIIDNPFVRMEAFGNKLSEIVIADAQSTLGMGLRMEGLADFIYSPQGWNNTNGKGLTGWQEGFTSPHLGLRFREPRELDIGALPRPQKNGPRLANNASTNPAASLPLRSLSRALQQAKEMLELETGSANMPGGAVMFGSSRADKRWYDKVVDAAFQLSRLGIPVWTGGSGGFMEAANTGAFKGGAQSVGVPISSNSKDRVLDKGLAREGVVPKDFQTMTFSTSGFATRIPTLIVGKRLIVAAPGGGGTMKEIAATLVMMAADPAMNRHIVLLDKNYYSGLYAWFTRLPLPTTIKRRITLVDTPAELAAFARQFEKELGNSAADLTEGQVIEREIPLPKEEVTSLTDEFWAL